MRLTAKSEYGLLALVFLAEREGDGPVSAREIAEEQRIPIKFLEQLLVTLRKSGLVTAQRGAHGGFVLGREASAITVLDVVEALEGPLSPSPCDGTRDCGRTSACAAAPIWEEAGQALRDVLGATTIATVASRQEALDAARSAAS
jgi:Rrf2 family transcriptional regulator, cysteine metabolism repressor